MPENEYWGDLKDRLRLLAKLAVSSLIDAGFLALWVVVQWLVNETLVGRLQLTGMSSYVLVVFRVVFAASTLVPVLVYIAIDIRVMILKGQARVRREVKLLEAKDPDGR